jgi:hypothetical protein
VAEDDSTTPAEEPALVDVLHRLGGVPVTKSLLDSSQEHEVLGIRIPVLPPTPIMIAKLRSFSEHYCDFEQPLARGTRRAGAAGLGRNPQGRTE